MRIFLLVLCFLLLILAGFAVGLVYTPWGAEWVVRSAARETLGDGKLSWSGFQGSLIHGVEVSHVEWRDVPYLPEGSFFRVQNLFVRLKQFSLNGFVINITNGRLFLPGDEGVFFNARLDGRVFSANIYTSSLDLGHVRGVLVPFFDVPPVNGFLRDIDLFVSGSLDHPIAQGKFVVDRLQQNEFVLQDIPVRAELNFSRGALHWGTYGKIFLDGGYLKNKVVRIDFMPSRLTFSGLPSRPELDIFASCKIARTRIDIRVKGTRQYPEVNLSSDPEYPREQLLLMLATGKRMSGIDSFSGKGKLPPAMASNFVDYFLFGGERSRIIHALGLSSISVNADQKKQGLTFSKDVTDRLGLDYGVAVGTAAQSQRGLIQRFEGEFQLTDKFMMGVQKEINPPRGTSSTAGAAGTDSEINPSPEDIPDDRVFLKYRTSF